MLPFLLVASNIPVIKEVEAITDPSAFTVVRFALSAIPFIPFVLRARDDVHTRNAGFELGLWVSLGYLMQALGLETSDAGRASFISMFTVSFLINLLTLSKKAPCLSAELQRYIYGIFYLNLSGNSCSLA